MFTTIFDFNILNWIFNLFAAICSVLGGVYGVLWLMDKANQKRIITARNKILTGQTEELFQEISERVVAERVAQAQEAEKKQRIAERKARRAAEDEKSGRAAEMKAKAEAKRERRAAKAEENKKKTEEGRENAPATFRPKKRK